MSNFTIAKQITTDLFDLKGKLSAVVCKRPDILEMAVTPKVITHTAPNEEDEYGYYNMRLGPEDVNNFHLAEYRLRQVWGEIVRNETDKSIVLHINFTMPSNGPWVRALSEIERFITELSFMIGRGRDDRLNVVLFFGTYSDQQTEVVEKHIRNLCHVYITDYSTLDRRGDIEVAAPNQLIMAKNEPLRQAGMKWQRNFNIIELAYS